MQVKDVRRYNMLVRVKEFGSTHADLFPPGSLGAGTFAELATAIDRLDGHTVAQASGRANAQTGALSKAAARQALRAAVEAIVSMARGIAVATPEVGKTFQLPRNTRDKELATTARQFVSDAAPYAAAFVARGLSSTFVADLQGKLDAFERASNVHAAARQAHITARADITAAVASAIAIVQQLDPIVEYRIDTDPGLLAAWQSARHVDRTGVSASKPVAGTTAPQPAQTAPAPPAPATAKAA